MKKQVQSSRNSAAPVESILSDWNHIQLDETTTPDVQQPATPSSEGTPSSSRLSTAQNASFQWSLPLESLVLDNRDSEIPLNLLRIYPAILRKFRGPPCEALGRCITYLQALFTESPGFHPYITHLPFGSLPSNESDGRHVAEALERELIRIVQHLLAFFYSDVNAVLQYINTCPEELIPRPLFVISTAKGSTTNQPNNGIEGFNNDTDGGKKVWQSPISQSVWRQQMEHDALQLNIRKCFQMIQRKHLAGLPKIAMSGPDQVGQQRRILQNQLPPPRPQIPISYPPAPTVPQFTPPMQPPMQPQYFGMQSTVPQVAPPAPRAPQTFYVPTAQHPMQFPVALPQPNVGPVNPPARATPQPMPAKVKPEIIPSTMQNNKLRDDIDRLEAEMTRLLALMSKDPPTSA